MGCHFLLQELTSLNEGEEKETDGKYKQRLNGLILLTVSPLHMNKFHSKSMCVNAIFLLNPVKVAEVPN